ncbi:MAG: STAS domain-containing protein [Planctomycetes bacterium]|nr:STAS domain-containing protein [Planctomycetota bacterium]
MTEIQDGGSLEREDSGNVTVLRVKVPMLRGDETTEALFQQASSLVEEAGRSQLVLNLDGVVFLASVAIGKLALLIHKTRAAGGMLTACKVSRTVGELLRMTHLADILPLYGDEQEAVRSFG